MEQRNAFWSCLRKYKEKDVMVVVVGGGLEATWVPTLVEGYAECSGDTPCSAHHAKPSSDEQQGNVYTEQHGWIINTELRAKNKQHKYIFTHVYIYIYM